MKTADKYKLCVSPLSGEAYISTIDKKGLMTDNRRKLDRKEVLAFICQWSDAEAEATQSNEINITKDGKRVLTIHLDNPKQE